MFIGIYTLEGKTYNNLYDKKTGAFDYGLAIRLALNVKI